MCSRYCQVGVDVMAFGKNQQPFGGPIALSKPTSVEDEPGGGSDSIPPDTESSPF